MEGIEIELESEGRTRNTRVGVAYSTKLISFYNEKEYLISFIIRATLKGELIR